MVFPIEMTMFFWDFPRCRWDPVLGVDTGDVCGEAPEPLRPQGDGGGVDLDSACRRIFRPIYGNVHQMIKKKSRKHIKSMEYGRNISDI